MRESVRPRSRSVLRLAVASLSDICRRPGQQWSDSAATARRATVWLPANGYMEPPDGGRRDREVPDMATWNPVDEWTTQTWRVSPSAVDPAAFAVVFARQVETYRRPASDAEVEWQNDSRLRGFWGDPVATVIGALQITNAPSGDE